MDTKTAESLVEIMKNQQYVIHEQQEKMAEQFQENFKKLHEIMQPDSTPSAPVYEKVRQNLKTDIAFSFSGIVDRLDKIETDLKALKAMSDVAVSEK